LRIVGGKAAERAVTQAVLYRAIFELEKRGQVEEFIAERRVRRHGNAQNPYSPLLSALTKGAHPRVRQILAKTAAMFALAREEGVEPEKFAEWRQQWPIEKACREWRGRKRRRDGGDQGKLTLEMFLVSDGILLPPVPQTRGYADFQLAVVKCAKDLTGAYVFVRVLPCGNKTFETTVLSLMKTNPAS
jgi:hypothetical protein